MARKKQEDPPKGLAPWMATFSDLMNLLLCFFVLLFSMSQINEEQFRAVAEALSESLNSSVLSGGSSAIGDGKLISSGVSQLNFLAENINEAAFEDSEDPGKESKDKMEDALAQIEREKQEMSENMANEIKEALELQGVGNQVDVTFTEEYALLTLNGALLFDSGKAEIKEDAIPLVDKVGSILTRYESNVIEVEGHTDNVPISGGRYENNKVLSTFRALSVADFLINEKGIDAAKLKYSGRGEYVPIATNDTEEGRALNRRVEIRIYNNYNEK